MREVADRQRIQRLMEAFGRTASTEVRVYLVGGATAVLVHFDLYAQALAKVERGHRQDLADVREMIARGLVDPRSALEYFARIEPDLFRFPAIDPPSFRRAVEEVFG